MSRHGLDLISLLPGLLFTGTALVFLFGDATVLDLGWAWLWPVLLAVLVIVGLTALVSVARRRQDGDKPPP